MVKPSLASVLVSWLGTGACSCTLTGSDLDPPTLEWPPDDLHQVSADSAPEPPAAQPERDRGAEAAPSDVPDLEGENLIENSDAEHGVSG